MATTSITPFEGGSKSARNLAQSPFLSDFLFSRLLSVVAVALGLEVRLATRSGAAAATDTVLRAAEAAWCAIPKAAAPVLSIPVHSPEDCAIVWSTMMIAALACLRDTDEGAALARQLLAQRGTMDDLPGLACSAGTQALLRRAGDLIARVATDPAFHDDLVEPQLQENRVPGVFA